MQILNTCGAPPYTLTIFSQDRFSSLKASTSVSPILGICNPHFILSLPCIILSAESIVAHASTFNLPMNDSFKQSWHYVTGRIMTTCKFGLQSQYTQTERTIEALKWPSFKSGNPASTFPSFVNSSIQRRVSSRNPLSTRTHNLAWLHYGVEPNTNSLRNSFAKS